MVNLGSSPAESDGGESRRVPRISSLSTNGDRRF